MTETASAGRANGRSDLSSPPRLGQDRNRSPSPDPRADETRTHAADETHTVDPRRARAHAVTQTRRRGRDPHLGPDHSRDRRPDRTSNRWLALVIACLAQFMVVLDATVVNVALPSIQRGLDFSSSSLPWVVNAYTLIFGGFLLLGGSAGDLLGRKRMFLVGTAVFAGGVAAERARAVLRDADRRPRTPGPRRRAPLPRRPVDHHHDLHRSGSGPRRSACGARSRPAVARSD